MVLRMRHWPIALVSSGVLNALLIAASMSSYPRPIDERALQRWIRVLGAPGGALTELLRGNLHPDAGVVLDLLISSLAVYVVIFWMLLTAFAMFHRRPVSVAP